MKKAILAFLLVLMVVGLMLLPSAFAVGANHNGCHNRCSTTTTTGGSSLTSSITTGLTSGLTTGDLL